MLMFKKYKTALLVFCCIVYADTCFAIPPRFPKKAQKTEKIESSPEASPEHSENEHEDLSESADNYSWLENSENEESERKKHLTDLSKQMGSIINDVDNSSLSPLDIIEKHRKTNPKALSIVISGFDEKTCKDLWRATLSQLTNPDKELTNHDKELIDYLYEHLKSKPHTLSLESIKEYIKPSLENEDNPEHFLGHKRKEPISDTHSFHEGSKGKKADKNNFDVDDFLTFPTQKKELLINQEQPKGTLPKNLLIEEPEDLRPVISKPKDFSSNSPRLNFGDNDKNNSKNSFKPTITTVTIKLSELKKTDELRQKDKS